MKSPERSTRNAVQELSNMAGEIEARLSKYRDRRAEIQRLADEAAADLQTAQEQAIDGGAHELITEAASRHAGIVGTLDKIDARTQEDEGALTSTRAELAKAEAHLALYEKAREADQKATAHHKVLSELDAAIQTAAERARDLSGEWEAASRDFIGALKILADNGEDPRRLTEALREEGIPITAALSDTFHHARFSDVTAGVPHSFPTKIREARDAVERAIRRMQYDEAIEARSKATKAGEPAPRPLATLTPASA